MYIFNEGFQILVDSRAKSIMEKNKKNRSWKTLTNKYERLYKIINEKLDNKDKKNLYELINTIEKIEDLKACIYYKCGIVDGSLLKEYKVTYEDSDGIF